MKKRFMYAAVICLILIAFMGQNVAPTSAAAQNVDLLTQLGDEIADVVERTQPAVVQVISTTFQKQQGSPAPFDQFEEMIPPQFRRRFQQPQREIPMRGLGSGFIIEANGIILTNNHVVQQTDDLKVVLDDGREYKAEVIGSDPETDVAVLKIDATDLPVLQAGNSDSLRVGQFVLAIGSPQGLSQTVSFGIVSAMNRSELRITTFDRFIQTDAAINRGNSGGPLLDSHGRVVGMSTAIVSTSGGSEGMGFAIPINQVLGMAKMIREEGGVSRGYLGIFMQELDPDMADYLGAGDRGGAVVTDIVPDAPAEGKLEPNDAIVALNGKELESSNDLLNQIAEKKPEDTVTLTVIRDGKKKDVKIKLAKRPGREELASRGKRTPEEESEMEDYDLGFQVQPLTPDRTRALGYDIPGGLLVTEVDPASEAYEKGLRPNMVIEQVNQQTVTSFQEMREAIEKEKDRKRILLKAVSPMGSQLIVIEKKKKSE
ncbi:Do family serine endopeptidase [bacterium]|nr:Do family serine endopeptidase [bacterium]